MGKINQLSQLVSNQIAAGEVVERPASVVKELVENALDAQAKKIELRIKAGGLEYIVVQDDGTGMDEEDVKQSFQRYATSKLSHIHDLDHLASFGFRGEALASIASVSKMSILSRVKDEEHGTKVSVNAGDLSECSRQGSLVGTRIEIRDLFFNTPARLKFIKSERAEASAVHKMLTNLAFVNPDVSFRFYKDEELIFELDAEDPWQERALCLLGSEYEGHLYQFDESTDLLRISGFVSSPMKFKKDGRGIHVFVNQRLVIDRKINGALKAAFRTLLEVGQHPVLLINIELAPNEVDVNVHPRKTELCFAQERRVLSHIIKLLGDFLANTPWLKPKVTMPSIPVSESFNEPKNYYQPQSLEASFRSESSWQPNNKAQFSLALPKELGFIKPQSQHLMMPSASFSDLRVIGQVCKTYLLMESFSGLVLIDQHAAHERVIFEKLIARKQDKFEKTTLLIPLSIRLDAHEMSLALAHQEDFLSFGIELEAMSKEHLVVRSLPDFMPQINVSELISDLLAEFLLLGRPESVDSIFDKVCATLACHGSIRAGQTMSHEEIRALLKQLDGISFSAHCPHGRPLVKSFSEAEIKKWFDRP